jgi:hypothetical protein
MPGAWRLFKTDETATIDRRRNIAVRRLARCARCDRAAASPHLGKGFSAPVASPARASSPWTRPRRSAFGNLTRTFRPWTWSRAFRPCTLTRGLAPATRVRRVPPSPTLPSPAGRAREVRR